MLKIEHVVLTSPEQMEFIVEGMRNPMNSWDKSDSNGLEIGENDRALMQRLVAAGTDHRKFMRMLPVYVRITAPLYFWKEFDTYKVGTVANSCSTMHKIHSKEFTLDDFSVEHLYDDSIELMEEVIEALNTCREYFIEWDERSDIDKEHFSKRGIWWQMIQLLPSSYNQIRNVKLNYEVLANIYKSRGDHRLDEWHEICNWIETLPYSELITGKKQSFGVTQATSN